MSLTNGLTRLDPPLATSPTSNTRTPGIWRRQTAIGVLNLPSYSPDLTPIEQAFAKIKATLRRLGARTREALGAAIAQAIDHITPRDARGFFHHCSYHSPTQLL